MKVNNVELVISAAKPHQYPDIGLPEFALAGRSNVGKSSFINKMIGRKSMARISSKPGKTQTLNFYKIEDTLFFSRRSRLWICESGEDGTSIMGSDD